MSNNGLELSRRKILAGLGTVGVASAGAGMGTSAFFSDTETFENNSLTAGELDLRIDWQQTYDGPSGDGAPYGMAGSPYVNAHPDHDNDGEQSLDLANIDGNDLTGEFDGVTTDDSVVEYSDSGSNIQDYLTCETLDNHTEDSFSNGNVDQEHLIELDDVKPGDRGEVTFSFHLCDNPGYIWLTGGGFSASEGGVTEPEGESPDEEGGVVELADEIIVRPWYDLDCDNVYEAGDGEDVIVDSPTTLRTLFSDRLTGKGRMLNPSVYSGGSDTTVTDPDRECRFLGKIEWGDGGDALSVETDDSGVDGSVVNEGTYSGGAKWYVVRIEDTVNNIEVHFLIDKFEFKDGKEGDFSEVIEFDWETLAGETAPDGTTYDSDAEGMCRLDVKTGGGPEDDTLDLVTGSACTSGLKGVCSPDDTGISYTEFYYCPPSDDGGFDTDFCFPAGQTFCVGFEWWLPASVGNEVQSDSVSFDIGFYTEQCRHNPTPDGPA